MIYNKDSHNRVMLIQSIAHMLNMSDDDLTVLLYAFIGDISRDASVEEILQKVSLPYSPVSYDIKKVKDLIEVINTSNGIFPKYQFSKIGETTYKQVYSNISRMFKDNPSYVFNTLNGIKEAIELLLEFVAEK